MADRCERTFLAALYPTVMAMYRTGMAALCLFAAMPARAAPFCVQTQAVPPQCLYFDAGACDGRARQMGGWCSTNPGELPIAGEQGRFCMVTSQRIVSCVFADENGCDAEARRQQGICVQSPMRPESPPPDPFREIRPPLAGG